MRSPNFRDLTLEEQKADIVLRTFVDPADHDYLVARWAHFNGFASQFLWSAAHCVEKYTKALLILNGQNIKGYGHEPLELFKEVEKLSPEIANLSVDTNIHLFGHEPECRNEAVRDFVTVLDTLGNPNVRYNITDTRIDFTHLTLIDALVYALRNELAKIRFDGRSFFEISETILNNEDKRDAMDWSVDHSLVLEKTFWKRSTVGSLETLRQAFLSNNEAFPSDVDLMPGFSGRMYAGSPIAVVHSIGHRNISANL